jgi:hypothetical protein
MASPMSFKDALGNPAGKMVAATVVLVLLSSVYFWFSKKRPTES